VCLFTGCAAVTRTATDVGLGAGGAALGGELSHNNPVAIVGGAAGGALLGEGLHYANSKQNDQSYQTGYDKGRSDAVKQQYWLYVSMQQAKAGDEGRVRLYPVHLPEQVIDGVIFKPTTQLLRIEGGGVRPPNSRRSLHPTISPKTTNQRKDNKHEKVNRNNRRHRPAAGVLRPRAVDRL
jgi:hypothetical protein